MIPQHILVKGFLSYRDEQEVTFDGGSLWMLSGPNGSGKSTVFDAVTYALFGQHRGGKQNARELINKESDGLVVEFDFWLDGQLYQARRTLKKSGRGTRQIHRWISSAEPEGKGEWEAVHDTSYDVGFTEWVREHIGLNYETFTSSVLLLQGKSEKLLAAEPIERFRVLAGIVDLGRFQRLFDRADGKRKELEATTKSLNQQLETLPEVMEAELQEVEGRVAAAEEAKHQAQAEVERLQRLEVQAERWADLQGRLVEARRQWDRAQGLLRQAEEIEHGWERLSELRLVLPHLEAAVQGRSRLAESVALGQRLALERQELVARLDRFDNLLDQTRKKRDERRQAIIEAEDREKVIGLRLSELSGFLMRLAWCDRQREELTRLEAQLAQLPANLVETLERQGQEHDRLSALGQVLPHLRRLHTERNDLRQARECAREAVEAEQATLAQVNHLTHEQAEAARQAEAASLAHHQARERATESRMLLKEAAEDLGQFGQLAGAKTCRQCGQALTPNHYELEESRRKMAWTAAESAFREADKTRQSAAREEKALLNLQKEVEARLEAARETAREHHRQHEQAERDAHRHLRECGQACRELPESLQSLVSPVSSIEWLATTYPTADDLADAERDVANLPTVRRQLQRTKALHDQWAGLRVQVATTRKTLAAQEAELPEEVPGLRQEHAALAAEDTALKVTLTSQRPQVRQEQDLLDQWTADRQRVSQQVADKDRQLHEQQLRRQTAEESIAAARGFLPAVWQSIAETIALAGLDQWQSELQQLEERGLEVQMRELQGARNGLEALRQRKTDLEREQEEVPAEGRHEPAEVRRRVGAAKQVQTAAEAVLAQARQEGARLTERRERRQQLQERFRGVDREHTLYQTLVEHLGRKGLQLHLVRQAERGIIDFANAVLDRLSGGQFCLRLRTDEGGDTDQALQLEAFDRQRDQVYSLPFLSGSQRFRVAVSLALGVGQYASRQHRPIESVIIDEGFGCLDREGRQVMIQEMQNLRSQLRCILLVSHQEEFAEAFADGYQFELTNGTTAVKRFQR